MENQHYKPVKGAYLFTDLEDAGVVLDVKNKTWWTLNETLSVILKSIENGLGTKEILEKFLLQYEIDSESCEEQIHSALGVLEHKGFIVKRLK